MEKLHVLLKKLALNSNLIPLLKPTSLPCSTNWAKKPIVSVLAIMQMKRFIKSTVSVLTILEAFWFKDFSSKNIRLPFLGLPSVLSQNDLWGNNIIFQFNENGPTDQLVAIIDWQFAGYCKCFFTVSISRTFFQNLSNSLPHRFQPTRATTSHVFSS